MPTKISPLLFTAPPARALIINNKEKLTSIIKKYQNKSYVHIDERRIYLDIYRLCSISFSKKLKGYENISISTYRNLVSNLLSGYLKRTQYAWASSRGEEHFVFMDVSPSRDTVLKIMGEFLIEDAKDIIFNTLKKDGYSIDKNNIKLADYLWMSVGRSHEEPGEILILTARTNRSQPKFCLADQLASTDTVISGAIISMMGETILEILSKTNKKIYKELLSGECLPLVYEAETSDEEDLNLVIQKKKIDYPIHIVEKTSISSLKEKSPSLITKITTSDSKFISHFIVECFYTVDEFNKILSDEQKQLLGKESFYLNIENAVYASIDIAGYSNLTSKVDRLSEITKIVNYSKTYKKYQYSARNTHTMVMGLQSLLAQWTDLATEIFTKYGFKTGEHGGDGMGAFKENVIPENAANVSLEIGKAIAYGFEKYLKDFHEDGGFSEAGVVVDLIKEIYPKLSDRPFLKITLAYLPQELRLRINPAGDYVTTDLILDCEGEINLIDDMMSDLKDYVRKKFPGHYKILAMNSELGSRIESMKKEDLKKYNGEMINYNNHNYFVFNK